MQISDFITEGRVLPDMRSATKQEALHELGHLVGQGAAPTEDIVRVLEERERLASTGIGEEIAIPHGKVDGVDDLVVGLGRSQHGVEFESVDGRPTRLFFVLVAPRESTGVHLQALARISRLCKEPGFRERLLQAPGRREMYDILCGEDAKFRAR